VGHKFLGDNGTPCKHEPIQGESKAFEELLSLQGKSFFLIITLYFHIYRVAQGSGGGTHPVKMYFINMFYEDKWPKVIFSIGQGRRFFCKLTSSIFLNFYFLVKPHALKIIITICKCLF